MVSMLHCVLNIYYIYVFWTITRAEQILENSGLSVAPPARVRKSVIAFQPSQAAQEQSTHVWQEHKEESSDESSEPVGTSYEKQITHNLEGLDGRDKKGDDDGSGSEDGSGHEQGDKSLMDIDMQSLDVRDEVSLHILIPIYS